jgi:hypothetical protein
MLAEADMRYVEVLQALKDLSVKGLLVCESPFQEVDALIMQETYRQLRHYCATGRRNRHNDAGRNRGFSQFSGSEIRLKARLQRIGIAVSGI